MSVISVFPAKAISESTVKSQRIGFMLKLEITDVLCARDYRSCLSVHGQTRSFIDVLYSTLSLKTRSFTF